MPSLGLTLSLRGNLLSSGAAPTPAFDPTTLFTGTDTGWVYDLSDMSTLFQDAAGTTPVTAVGQPVGRCLDLSGKGNHRTQSTALNRPTYQVDENGNYYLSYDGINDSLATASFAWGTDKATVVAGVMKLSDAATASIVELSTSLSVNSGVVVLFAPVSPGATYTFVSKGTTQAVTTTSGSFAAPTTNVLTGLGDISGDLATLRVDGTQVAQTTADQGTGNYGTYPAYFGARAGTSLFFNGREYSNVGINRLLTADELAALESWTADKVGITL